MSTPKNQSLSRALVLLEQVASAPRGTGIKVLAMRAGLSVATAHRLLSTLESLGMVMREGSAGYCIGMTIRDLAAHTGTDELIRRAATPHLKSLVKQFGQTVHVGVLDEDLMVTYVAKETPKRGFQVMTRLNAQLEAYCTGLGKVLLAAEPHERQRSYLADSPFVALTPNTLTDPESIAAELDRVRAQGYALDNCEILETLRCVAVPIHGPAGRVVAALSMSGDRETMTDAFIAEAQPVLSEHAARISRKLFPQLAGAQSAVDTDEADDDQLRAPRRQADQDDRPGAGAG